LDGGFFVDPGHWRLCEHGQSRTFLAAADELAAIAPAKRLKWDECAMCRGKVSFCCDDKRQFENRARPVSFLSRSDRFCPTFFTGVGHADSIK
jgi:hypothetical protein